MDFMLSLDRGQLEVTFSQKRITIKVKLFGNLRIKNSVLKLQFKAAVLGYQEVKNLNNLTKSLYNTVINLCKLYTMYNKELY